MYGSGVFIRVGSTGWFGGGLFMGLVVARWPYGVMCVVDLLYVCLLVV